MGPGGEGVELADIDGEPDPLGLGGTEAEALLLADTDCVTVSDEATLGVGVSEAVVEGDPVLDEVTLAETLRDEVTLADRLGVP